MTPEQNEKLEQAADKIYHPVSAHKEHYLAGAQTILDNPSEWGLVTQDRLSRERNKWIKDRHERGLNHNKALLDACGQIVDLEDEVSRLRVALGMSDPWPLTDILSKLIEASETLLHERGYDGHQPGQMPYEDINICVDEAKKAIERIKEALKQLK